MNCHAIRSMVVMASELLVTQRKSVCCLRARAHRRGQRLVTDRILIRSSPLPHTWPSACASWTASAVRTRWRWRRSDRNCKRLRADDCWVRQLFHRVFCLTSDSYDPEVHLRDVRVPLCFSGILSVSSSASKAKEVLAVEVVGLQSMADYQRKRSFLVSGGAQSEEAALYIERQKKCASPPFSASRCADMCACAGRNRSGCRGWAPRRRRRSRRRPGRSCPLPMTRTRRPTPTSSVRRYPDTTHPHTWLCSEAIPHRQGPHSADRLPT